MKGIAALFALFVLIFGAVPAVAQTETTGSVGVTPDSALWGIDVALDRIRLALANGDDAKARVGLKIAEERLLEVRVAVEANKLEAAQKAEREHGRSLDDVKIRVRALQKDRPEDELDDVVEIETDLEEHDADVEETRERFEAKMRIRGELTPQQQELLKAFLASLDNSTGDVRVEIREKKGEIRAKFEARGDRKEEINEEFNETERRHLQEFFKEGAAKRIENAKKAIADAKEAAAALEASIGANNTNDTHDDRRLSAGLHLIGRAEFHLNVSEQSVADGQFGKAFGQATAAWRIARNAERVLTHGIDEKEALEDADEQEERHIEKIEIEIETEGNMTHVEVEIRRDGVEEEVEFDIASADRETIITEIDARTSLTRGELEKLIGPNLTVRASVNAKFRSDFDERMSRFEEKSRTRMRADVKNVMEKEENETKEEDDDNETEDDEDETENRTSSNSGNG